MKTLVLAEKSSVANELAIYFKALTLSAERTYYENDDYIITWAVGHLFGLAEPAAYGFAKWELDTLPIMPEIFILEPNPNTTKQLNSILELLKRSKSIIVATDAAREGELIFRYIYEYAKSSLPFERMWVQSLTKTGIDQAFKTRKNGHDYDNLYQSAYSRAKADWTIGMNYSRAYTLQNVTGQAIKIGRVKTPTPKIDQQRRYDKRCHQYFCSM